MVRNAVWLLAVGFYACRPQAGSEPEKPGDAAPSAPQASPTPPVPEPVAPTPPAPIAEAEPPAPAEPAPPPTQPPIPEMKRGGPNLVVTDRIETGNLPKSVEVSPDGRYVYVCNFGWKNKNNVWRYDAKTHARAGTIEFKGNAVETAFTSDSKTVYVSSFSGAKIIEVDAESLSVQREIKVGANPKVMVLSPDEKRLYVANWSSDSVSVVDLEAGKTVQSLKTGDHPRGMAVRDDGELFVNAMYSHKIHVFGGAEKVEELREFKSCKYPRHATFVPDASSLFVSCSGADKLYWYDPDSGRRRGWANVGDNPRSVAMTSNGRWFAVADYSGGTVSLVDTHNGTYGTHAVDGAEKIVGVAVQPGPGLKVYATSWLSHEMVVMEPDGALPAVEAAPAVDDAPASK